MEELLLLCEFFHQDITVLYPDLNEALRVYLTSLKQVQLANLEEFLKASLENKSDQELALLWRECSSDWDIDQKDIRAFFTKILAKTREYR